MSKFLKAVEAYSFALAPVAEPFLESVSNVCQRLLSANDQLKASNTVVHLKDYQAHQSL